MILFHRFGFLSFLGFGVGVAMALGLGRAFGLPYSGPALGSLVFGCAALVNLVLALWVYPRLDKPVPLTVTRQLAEPYTWPDGRVQTHEVVQAQTPDGQPAFTTPVSRLFFVPAKYLWIVLVAVAAILGAVAAFIG